MRQRGFTLLEMVIGMTLLGLILLLLYSGLRLGSRSWDAGERVTNGVSRQVAVTDYLRRQLGMVYPLRWKRDGQEVLAFAGEHDRLHFAAPIPAQLGAGGVHLLALEQIREGETGELRLRWHIPAPEASVFDFPDQDNQAPLVRDVAGLEFTYFGAESEGEEPSWRDTWHSETQLPRLIRLRLAQQKDGPWPEVVVAPVLVADTGCVWDDFYKRCRR